MFRVLGGSWDLVSTVLNTLIGIVSPMSLQVKSRKLEHDYPHALQGKV